MLKKTKALIYFILEDMEVEAPVGSSFQDIVDIAKADLSFGCRNGSCGTCRIRIEEGLSNISEKSSEEKDFLESIHAEPNERLGCQIKILGSCKINYLGN